MARLVMWCLAVVIVLLCARCQNTQVNAAAAPATQPFKFSEYFNGEWDIVHVETTLKEMNLENAVPGVYRVNLVKQNDTEFPVLSGSSFLNHSDTFEVSEERFIELEFSDDGNTGVYKTGDNYDSMSVLFEFAFTVLPDHGSVSVGTWNSDPVSYYQFLVHSPEKFTITLLPTSDDENAPVHLYLGKKVIYPPNLTFFQKYGSYIMIGGVFLLNTYMQQKFRNQQGAQAAAGAPARPAAATTTGAAKPAAGASKPAAKKE